jgi:predicted transcriptional regulator
MRLQALKLKVLKLLAENAINNASPQVMDTDAIASILDIRPAEAKQLLKILHASGLIITNMEEQYSLITQEGIDWLNQVTFIAHRPREPHQRQPAIS